MGLSNGPLKLRGFSCQYVRKPITGSNKQQAVVLPVTAVMLINRPSVISVFSIRRGLGLRQRDRLRKSSMKDAVPKLNAERGRSGCPGAGDLHRQIAHT